MVTAATKFTPIDRSGAYTHRRTDASPWDAVTAAAVAGLPGAPYSMRGSGLSPDASFLWSLPVKSSWLRRNQQVLWSANRLGMLTRGRDLYATA